MVQRLSAILLNYFSASIQLKCKQISATIGEHMCCEIIVLMDVFFSSVEVMLTAS